jgi:hypothetical protein
VQAKECANVWLAEVDLRRDLRGGVTTLLERRDAASNIERVRVEPREVLDRLWR